MKRKTTKEEQLYSLKNNYIRKEVIDKLNDTTYNFEGEVNSEENRYMLRNDIIQYLNDVYPRFSNYINVKVQVDKYDRNLINIKFVDKQTHKENYLENLIRKYYSPATLTISI